MSKQLTITVFIVQLSKNEANPFEQFKLKLSKWSDQNKSFFFSSRKVLFVD